MEVQEQTQEQEVPHPNPSNPDFDGTQFSPQFAVVLKNFILKLLGSGSSIVGRSHKTSNQTISTGSSTKVVWEANDYAEGITWDGGNNRFTILSAGKYLVSSSVLYANTVDGSLYGIRIFINGSEVAFHQSQAGNAGGTISSLVFDTADLVVGSYVEIFVFHNSGGSRDLAGGTISNCYFNIAKIN